MAAPNAPADPLDVQLLRPRDAAELLNVSAAEVRRLARTGRLPALRIGGVVRLHPAHVARLAARRTRLTVVAPADRKRGDFPLSAPWSGRRGAGN